MRYVSGILISPNLTYAELVLLNLTTVSASSGYCSNSASCFMTSLRSTLLPYHRIPCRTFFGSVTTAFSSVISNTFSQVFNFVQPESGFLSAFSEANRPCVFGAVFASFFDFPPTRSMALRARHSEPGFFTGTFGAFAFSTSLAMEIFGAGAGFFGTFGPPFPHFGGVGGSSGGFLVPETGEISVLAGFTAHSGTTSGLKVFARSIPLLSRIFTSSFHEPPRVLSSATSLTSCCFAKESGLVRASR